MILSVFYQAAVPRTTVARVEAFIAESRQLSTSMVSPSQAYQFLRPASSNPKKIPSDRLSFKAQPIVTAFMFISSFMCRGVFVRQNVVNSLSP